MADLMGLADLRRDLRAVATPAKAQASAWFFKTGPGQYAEGDQFIGVTVPEQRVIAKRYRDLPLEQTEQLVTSPIHEERLTGLIILVAQYERGDEAVRREIYNFYLSHTAHINNWDLVDSSAELIVGPYLQDRDRSILMKLAKSDSLSERRIAMLATFYYIKQGDSTEALKIAEILLHDPHDLIQKAVGWMLREIGNRCGRDVEEAFLLTHYQTMPRTMLRYAIERFEPERRQAYLRGMA
jgi:3-methyladenine DNA glycosylase AlkD